MQAHPNMSLATGAVAALISIRTVPSPVENVRVSVIAVQSEIKVWQVKFDLGEKKDVHFSFPHIGLTSLEAVASKALVKLKPILEAHVKLQAAKKTHAELAAAVTGFMPASEDLAIPKPPPGVVLSEKPLLFGGK
jgi:hypothetical protein